MTSASRLEALARSANVVSPYSGGQLGGIGKNPNGRQLLRIAADTALFPAVRFSMLRYAVVGACLNEREMIFGPSDNRHVVVDSLLWALRDIPRVNELRALHHQTLDRIQESPLALLTVQPLTNTSTASIASLVVPRTVRERVMLCRAMH